MKCIALPFMATPKPLKWSFGKRAVHGAIASNNADGGARFRASAPTNDRRLQLLLE